MPSEDDDLSTVEHEGRTMKVRPEHAELALALLRARVDAMDIVDSGAPGRPAVSVVLPSPDDVEHLLRVLAAHGSDSLLDALEEDGDLHLSGFFTSSASGDDVGSVLFVDVPPPLVPEFVSALLAFSAEMEGFSPNVSLGSGAPVRLSDIPRFDWDGTFEPPVPTGSIDPGCVVKLGFHGTVPEHVVERVWVRVTSVDGDAFEGVLESDPVAARNLSRGDPVSFRRHDIIEAREGEIRLLN